MNTSKTTETVAAALLREAVIRRADPKAVWGISWGYDGLNALTGGIQRNEMTLLMARPGVGKTSMMEDITLAVCDWRETEDGQEYMDKHAPGGVIRLVLLEMTAENFQQRLTCKRAHVSTRKVREGKLTDEQFARYEAASVEIANLPIEYIDQPNGLQDTERFLSQTSRPTLWWALDYAQIHQVGGGITAGDRSAMNLISGTLRNIAKNVAPGLVLSQMTREVDKREDKRPQLADLLGTGQFEADASVVLGVYRADVYQRVADEERDEPRPAELLLLKQRNGPTNRTIDMLWHPLQMHFQDISGLLAED